MPISVESIPPQVSPVEAARVAIWRLYQEGYVDEDMATAGLLAVDLGTRRAQQLRTRPTGRAHSTSPDRRRRAVA
jgi:hypothetical protein